MDNLIYSEIRKDPIVGRWVIVNKDRGYLPELEESIKRPMFLEHCPFCAGNEALTPKEILTIVINSEHKWDIRVIPNKYPALIGDIEIDKEGIGIFDKMSGFGFHEVVIETPEHSKSLSDLSKGHIFQLFKVFQQRVLALKEVNQIKYILIFKNEGKSAGASIQHSHSQIIATPIIPKRVKEELDGADFYYDYKERCIFCDIIKEEKSHVKERIIFENDNTIVLSPYAARFPFEAWILPKNHYSHIEFVPDDIYYSLAESLLFYLKALNKVLNYPPYNLIIHTSPIGNKWEKSFHFHIEILPKIKKVAGFEWGTGFYINPVSPEESSEILRKALQ